MSGPTILRLYVAGQSPNSLLALSNLRAALDGRAYELEVVDVLATPDRALDDGVFVTPTLVRVSPEPSASAVGTLNDSAAVLRLLD